jgi:DNA topoisomerase 2-associated protein PAT1
MIINNYSQLDVVVYASILDNPVASPDREELERQTEVFMHSVLSNFLPLIGELSLAPVIHIITLLLRRANFVFVARSQVS